MQNPFPTMKIRKHHMFLHACVLSHSNHLPTMPSPIRAISQCALCFLCCQVCLEFWPPLTEF